MRVDYKHMDQVADGIKFAMSNFAGLPSEMTGKRRQEYWQTVRVPYCEPCAYEEKLAIFDDVTGSRTSLLSAYERITAYITDGAVTTLPPIPEKLRKRAEAMIRRSSRWPGT